MRLIFDGPPHQPIEQLAMPRATPNPNVFRPADSVETVECWEIALRSTETPSIHSDENLCARGAYVLPRAGAP